MNRSKNCISYWFPLLSNAGIPVPRTVIAEVPDQFVCDIMCIEEAGEDQTVLPWEELVESLITATGVVGLPCFLRTGHTSGKHNWKNTCYIDSVDQIDVHMFNLVEFSNNAGFIGLPVNVWAVREYLDGHEYFKCQSYGNMPVRREFRAFVTDGALQCLHPYWPAGAIKAGRPDINEWPNVLHVMNNLTDNEIETLVMLAERAGDALGVGSWSIDMLGCYDGWFVTDVAITSNSWHWPSCPFTECNDDTNDEEPLIMEGMELL